MKPKRRIRESQFQDDRYYLTVDIDERGEYGATLYDYNDKQVWDCDTETVYELIEDGYLKYKPDQDLDRLTKYLSSNGTIPKGSTIDDEKEDEDMEENRRMRENKKSKRRVMLENRLRQVIRPIVRSILKESISPQETDFLESLKKNKGVLELANHYEVDPDVIIKQLRVRLSVKRDITGNVKKVSIDFTDTNSGIKVKDSVSF
tara:strand:+ start:1246 stop:1857 length:612 start_codon:yes stop_codon:yes gene_type:complete